MSQTNAPHANHVMAAIGMDSMPALHRFHKFVSSKLSDVSYLHLYEHRNKLFSLHGHDDINLALSLLPTGSHTPAELPAADALPALPTLLLDAAAARTAAAGALFSQGHKVTVWTVAADGRVMATMDGTPGCPGSLSEWLGERSDDGVVLALSLSLRGNVPTLGLVCWDPAHVSLRASDIADTHQYAALESICVATNARELLIGDDVPEFEREKIGPVAQRCNVAVTVRRKKLFDATNVLQSVARLCGAQLQFDQMLDGKQCAGAMAALIEYCGLENDPGLEGHVRMAPLSFAASMQLDSGVMRALNILPFPGDGGKKASLFGLLNRCKNVMGSRLLRQWLSQPLQSVDDINTRLDLVDMFMASADTTRTVRDDHLAKYADMYALCRRFTRDGGKRATMQDAVRLYQCAVRLPSLCHELDGITGGKHAAEDDVLNKHIVAPLRKLSGELRNYEALIELTIDLEKMRQGEFVVAPSMDPELERLRDLQTDVLAHVTNEYERVKYELGDTLKLERKDNLGYFFRLTRKEERAIRGNGAYLVIETRKDGVRFQTMELRKRSRRYEEIAADYNEKEKENREQTLQVAGTYAEVFIDVATVLAQLDVVSAFATVAQESRAGYTRPKMTAAGSGLFLTRARHPVVEENLADDAEFIANDIDLRRRTIGDGGAEGGRLVLVTGPNMGGKSTYIRSAGVLTLMAHVGMYVPADEAEVPITDRIFARVGAADNQHRAVSTFMSEMLETAAIVRDATARSLVIIDELGRGTGTTDGYGLAHAISKYIAKEVRAACLFATHFYELTTLADDPDMRGIVANRHVTATTTNTTTGASGAVFGAGPGATGPGKLTFLYEVMDGACDQSFGVHVAEMAHFPPQVVQKARDKASEMEVGVSGNADMQRKLEGVPEAERKEGVALIMEMKEKMDALPRATGQEVKQSARQLMKMRDDFAKTTNRYVRIMMGVDEQQ